MQGALGGADAIGMACLRDETFAAVLQGNAGLGRDDARTETIIDRIDEGNAQAVLVDDRQVNRIGTGKRDRAIAAVVHVDEACQPL